MQKSEINSLLTHNLNLLVDYYNSKSDDAWTDGPENKWTSGQHALHLVQSIDALVKGLRMPTFLLRWKFGTANRPSRDFDAIVFRYHEKLAKVQGAVSPFSKNMSIPSVADKQKTLMNLQTSTAKLQKQLSKLSDRQLDQLLLPHPLMGRMTVREIITWTAYHTQHHLNVLQEKY